ncbi:alpha/beta-hydrolase family protein [Thioalkalivibrio sp. XN279]|uniref:alpha/beta hydrolase n=1 Tax=Thioalkalivibrio sp. XN279 TaxID=2714953 RepID=UPI001F0D1B22|nr:alpha/beta-hydrolase family protein [Thioalkalivibrio sp. XN279]
MSIVGVLVGTVFFAISLSPSLLPRPFVVQGVLSGASFAVGYGLGVAGLVLWRFLKLPVAGPRLRRALTITGSVLCALVAIAFLWQASTWQNSIRALMGMEADGGLRPSVIGPVAILVFAVLLALARLFRRLFRFLSRRLDVYVPRRVSYLVSIMLAVAVSWSAIDGVLVSALLRTADNSFQQLDALIEDDLPRPTRPEQTGSANSLVAWSSLGRQGRRFVSGGPDAATLSAFFDADLPAPVRVYVGLNSADSPEERARLALEELIRAGGFERSVLLLATPTGTGWIDPAGQGPVEYLFRGDIATVAVQYSYLNSPLALLTEAAYGAETARAVFLEIYGYWRELPAESRPRLFLGGLSLGSLNSDLSFDLFDIIDDPFEGVLWAGPPFRNESWQRMVRDRDPGSPAWLPRFRDGAVVRFTLGATDAAAGRAADYAPWGDFRIVVLQYPSDPITFFEPSAAWRRPAWMQEPRGPGVTPELRWFPIVTMLQLAADMVVGTAPQGFGHEYSPRDYISAWLALTEPPGWTQAEIERLERLFE